MIREIEWLNIINMNGFIVRLSIVPWFIFSLMLIVIYFPIRWLILGEWGIGKNNKLKSTYNKWSNKLINNS